MRLLRRSEVVAIAFAFVLPLLANAQPYPSKVIRIVTAAAGGGSDFNARQIAQGISGPLGQSVIVDNRTPLQAAEMVMKAPADGYSLMVGGDSLWTLALLRPTPYDPVNDFSPISLISMDVNVLTVHPSLPAKSVRELIVLAKARPANLTTARRLLAVHRISQRNFLNPWPA